MCKEVTVTPRRQRFEVCILCMDYHVLSFMVTRLSFVSFLVLSS